MPKIHGMFQRIQTIFLLISFAISLILLKVPVYHMVDAMTTPAPETASSPKSFVVSGNALLMILNCAVGLLSLFAIFLYKSRNLQARLCNLGLLLVCVLIGLLFFLADTMSSSMNQKVEYGFGTYLPLIQLLFLFLAGIFIRRDEELVRSANRLR